MAVAGNPAPIDFHKLGMKVPVAPVRRLSFYFEIREKLEKLPPAIAGRGARRRQKIASRGGRAEKGACQ
jgi:hypothetical protein